MKIESFQVYHLSEKTRAVIRSGSKSVTVIKRINPMVEAQVRLTREELAHLFHVTKLRELPEEILKIMNDEKEGEENA